MAHQRIRTFNKYVTNRITSSFAGLPWGPFALIRHIGRRSGKTYQTPIMVERSQDRFVIALTYGPEVDWYRNILAAGHASLVWHGRDYTLNRPQPLAAKEALSCFSPFQRPILRMLGTKDFVSCTYQEKESHVGDG